MSTLVSQNTPRVSEKLVFRLSGEKNYTIHEGSDSDMNGTIISYDKELEIEYPKNTQYAMVYGSHKLLGSATIWHGGLQKDRFIYLLELDHKEPEPGWLLQSGTDLNILYNSVFLHPEFPHLTSDLQYVEHFRWGESILGIVWMHCKGEHLQLSLGMAAMAWLTSTALL